MEAKDTIIKTTVYNCHNTLEERLVEQAGISFKAGIRKVVKFVETYNINAKGLCVYPIEIPGDKWQAKLAELHMNRKERRRLRR